MSVGDASVTTLIGPAKRAAEPVPSAGSLPRLEAVLLLVRGLEFALGGVRLVYRANMLCNSMKV